MAGPAPLLSARGITKSFGGRNEIFKDRRPEFYGPLVTGRKRG